jgi:hypothetical protein
MMDKWRLWDDAQASADEPSERSLSFPDATPYTGYTPESQGLHASGAMRHAPNSGPLPTDERHFPQSISSDSVADPSSVDAFASDSNADELHDEVALLLASLSQRGTGQHVCPSGHSCTKGGVAGDGSLVVFPRNSAFRYVREAPSVPFHTSDHVV